MIVNETGLLPEPPLPHLMGKTVRVEPKEKKPKPFSVTTFVWGFPAACYSAHSGSSLASRDHLPEKRALHLAAGILGIMMVITMLIVFVWTLQ